MSTELTPKQQFAELVKNAQNVLVLVHHNPDGDALGSGLAMKLGLEKLGKQATLALTGAISDAFDFLPGIETADRDFKASKDLLVVIDESQARVGNVSLKRVSDSKLMVVITPKDGFFTPTNIRIEDGSFQADLILVLDCTDLERTGSIYAENSNLFFEVPVVNIDHHPDNINFGKVNLVDVTASSTAEILVSLLETIGKDVPGMIDGDIATCLLTGIASDTGSFQNANTTPKALTVAAQMVAAGARQQEIVKHIFQAHKLSQLRLWGRALSYIKEDVHLKFAWSVLTKADFVAAQADLSETDGLIGELLKSAVGPDFVLLLIERNGEVKGSLRSVQPQVDVSRIAHLFGGGGHVRAAGFEVPNTTIAECEQMVIGKIRDFLQGNLPADGEPLTPAVSAPAAMDDDTPLAMPEESPEPEEARSMPSAAAAPAVPQRQEIPRTNAPRPTRPAFRTSRPTTPTPNLD